MLYLLLALAAVQAMQSNLQPSKLSVLLQTISGDDLMQVVENTPSGESIALVSTVDADGAEFDTHVFTVDNNDWLIEVRDEGPVLLTNVAFDYETQQQSVLTITATDVDYIGDGENSFSEEFVFTIIDLNDEVPTDISFDHSPVFNECDGDASFELTFVDADSVNEFTFELLYGNDAAAGVENFQFVVGDASTSTGGLRTAGTLIMAPTLDYEALDSWSWDLTLSLNDGVNSVEYSFPVSLEDCNDRMPELTLAESVVALPENTLVGGPFLALEVSGSTGYHDAIWTEAWTVDGNGKYEAFNYECNTITVEMSGATIEWTHNLGMSLADIFASGQSYSSSVDTNTWKNVLGAGVAPWQNHCNTQGFNVIDAGTIDVYARFGLIMNQENNCDTPDTSIGLGLDHRGVNIGAGAGCSCCQNGGTCSNFLDSAQIYVSDCSSGGSSAVLTTFSHPPASLEASEVYTYALSSTDTSFNVDDLFEIDGNTIRTKVTFDYETASPLSYPLTVECNDGIFDTFETLTVSISDENDNAPANLVCSASSFAESEGALEVCTISFDDADTVGTHSLLVLSDQFENDGMTISTRDAMDFDTLTNTDFTFNVEVSDGVFTTIQELTLSLTDVNDQAPAALNLDGQSILESAAIGDVVGTFTWVDTDTVNEDEITLSGAAASAFAMDGSSLVVAAALDWETTASYDGTLSISDGVHTSSMDFTIYVDNVNEHAPSDIAITAGPACTGDTVTDDLGDEVTVIGVPETVSTGTKVVSMSFADLDRPAITELSASIQPSEFTLGAISSLAEGEYGVDVLTTVDMDYETVSQYAVTVSLADANHEVFSTFEVNVVNEDDELPTDILLNAFDEGIVDLSTYVVDSGMNSHYSNSLRLTDATASTWLLPKSLPENVSPLKVNVVYTSDESTSRDTDDTMKIYVDGTLMLTIYNDGCNPHECTASFDIVSWDSRDITVVATSSKDVYHVHMTIKEISWVFGGVCDVEAIHSFQRSVTGYQALFSFEDNLMDEPMGFTLAADGTTAYAGGAIGRGFDFDGATRLSMDFEGAVSETSFGISMWVRGGIGGLFCMDTSGHDRHLYVADGGVLQTRTWPSTTTVSDSTGVDDGQWHHVVYTFGSEGEYIYLDNVVVSHRADVTQSNYDWDEHAYFGWSTDNGFYTGRIDEAQLFMDQLSAQEVEALFSARSDCPDGDLEEPEPAPEPAPEAASPEAIYATYSGYWQEMGDMIGESIWSDPNSDAFTTEFVTDSRGLPQQIYIEMNGFVTDTYTVKQDGAGYEYPNNGAANCGDYNSDCNAVSLELEPTDSSSDPLYLVFARQGAGVCITNRVDRTSSMFTCDGDNGQTCEQGMFDSCAGECALSCNSCGSSTSTFVDGNGEMHCGDTVLTTVHFTY